MRLLHRFRRGHRFAPAGTRDVVGESVFDKCAVCDTPEIVGTLSTGPDSRGPVVLSREERAAVRRWMAFESGLREGGR